MHRLRLPSCAVLVSLALAAADCRAIEMFTYFGDGSRIGLPSLEVPVEAYPGIPLRSDRLRARRRTLRAGPGTAAPVATGTPIGGGMTIRAMPTEPMVAPEPPAEPLVAPRPQTKQPTTTTRSAPQPDRPTTR